MFFTASGEVQFRESVIDTGESKSSATGGKSLQNSVISKTASLLQMRLRFFVVVINCIVFMIAFNINTFEPMIL